MSSPSRFRRVLVFAVALTSTLFAIASTCDPQVRTTIFGGFNSLANSLVNALFIKLQDTGSTNVVTVQAAPATPAPAVG